MFLFDFTSIVTRANVRFCDRKMAHVGILSGDDQAYFDAIDFARVYHDRSITDPVLRQDINDRRMAEVLVPDDLPLDVTLASILCRTNLDAMSLQHLLRGHDPSWRSKLRVATKPAEMFFCWGAYITELQFGTGALTLRVKASHDYTRTGVEVQYPAAAPRPTRDGLAAQLSTNEQSLTKDAREDK